MKISLFCNSDLASRSSLDIDFNFSFPDFTIIKDAYLYKQLIINGDFINENFEKIKYFAQSKRCNLNNLYSIKDNEIIELKGTYLLCLNHFSHNYSHFLLQSVGVFLYASSLNMLNNSLNIIINDNLKFQKEFIYLYGIDKYNIISYNNEKIYKIERAVLSNLWYKNCYHKDFISLYLKKLIKSPHINGLKNYYLTRINNANRRAINEKNVIDYMEKSNYEVLDFDKLSCWDQINFIYNSKNICAPHGASGTNWVYINNDYEHHVTEIFSTGRKTNIHTNILTSKNCVYSGTLNKSIDVSCKDSPYKIDIQSLARALNAPPLINFSIYNNSYYSLNNLKKVMSKNNVIPQRVLIIDRLLKLEKQSNMILALQEILNVVNSQPFEQKFLEYLLKYMFIFCLYEQALYYLKKYENKIHKKIFYRYLFLCYIYQKDFLSAFIMLKYLKVYLDEKNFFIYQSLYDTIKYNSNIIISNHLLPICYEPESCSISLKGSLSLKVYFEYNKLVLYIPSEKKYISNILDNGLVELSYQKKYFEFTTFGKTTIAIPINTTYLSSRKDGSFGLRAICREWEIYNII